MLEHALRSQLPGVGAVSRQHAMNCARAASSSAFASSGCEGGFPDDVSNFAYTCVHALAGAMRPPCSGGCAHRLGLRLVWSLRAANSLGPPDLPRPPSHHHHRSRAHACARATTQQRARHRGLPALHRCIRRLPRWPAANGPNRRVPSGRLGTRCPASPEGGRVQRASRPGFRGPAPPLHGRVLHRWWWCRGGRGAGGQGVGGQGARASPGM